jgi:hypothetical protein
MSEARVIFLLGFNVFVSIFFNAIWGRTLAFFYTESLNIMTNKLSSIFSIGQIHYIKQNIDSLYYWLCVCVAMEYTHLPY